MNYGDLFTAATYARMKLRLYGVKASPIHVLQDTNAYHLCLRDSRKAAELTESQRQANLGEAILDASLSNKD